ncbi:hypothetical protein QJS10_CPA10g00351 [Acorus calamus]|uniref:Polygalacturonase n=1 Tax=Acorus calamus TaxID=4465 RepID=A0AAV9DXM7_ACOCL|nr:hypothetical protein QJS10_CPA10g00351 [Acorus calamus]
MGDDCVTIGEGSVDVNVTNLACGPGHGISSRSKLTPRSAIPLARVMNYDRQRFWRVYQPRSTCLLTTVVQVDPTVSSSKCTYLVQNGVRIKTWQGGSGYARNALFEQIHFNQVDNPIIIDQYYCNGARGQCANETSAVQISNVRYNNLHGSASGHGHQPCLQPKRGLHRDRHGLINISSGISGKPATSYCLNVHGSIQGSVSPAVSCLH